MAHIFDNIDQDFLGALRATMQVSKRSDFCVEHLNLQGWQAIDDLITPWDPTVGQVCRVLVGMQRPPYDEIRELYLQTNESGLIDNAWASERARLRAELDSLATHLHCLSEEEFAHILTTFPPVLQPVEMAVQNAYRDVEKGLIQ